MGLWGGKAPIICLGLCKRLTQTLVLLAGAGAAVVLLMSATPLFKNDVLIKIPVVSL